MIRVLVVEDSPTVRAFLVEVLSQAPGISVAGTATNGEEALEMVQRIRPDLVTMDVVMPGMDGLEATRRIMESHPLPIVIVSAHVPTAEAEASFRALKAGALAVVPRPTAFGDPTHSATARHLLRMIDLMSEVKVVRRWRRLEKEGLTSPGVAAYAPRAAASPALAPAAPAPADPQIAPALIGIGGSTGAPVIIESILSRLPQPYSVPILIVQHIAAGFVEGFSQWLARSTGQQVQLAGPGETIRPGRVYVAPDGFQMGIDHSGQVALASAPPENGHRPAVSFLFRSLAQEFGPRAVGVLLSGMGTDGADGLLMLRRQGALTLAQDPETSVVYGMPAEAVRLGAVMQTLTPEGIAAFLTRFHRPLQPTADLQKPNR